MKLWFAQSLAAMLLLVPAWLSLNFFRRNFHVPGEVFLMWYFGMSALGVGFSKLFTGGSLIDVFPSLPVVTTMALVGLIFGATANTLLFRAVTIAPNPGLPVAISGAASVFVFLVSVVLGKILPHYFSATRLDWAGLFGVLLIIAGVFIIAYRRG